MAVGLKATEDARVGRVVIVRARLAVRGIWRRARRIIVSVAAVLYFDLRRRLSLVRFLTGVLLRVDYVGCCSLMWSFFAINMTLLSH